MEADLRNLIALIRQKLPLLYPRICEEDVQDYLEHGEFGLAFELLTFNAEEYIGQLTPDVLKMIAHILRAYDLHGFSKDPKIKARYDKFVQMAKAG